MKNSKNKLKNKTKSVTTSFTGGNITKYSGLKVVGKYLNREGIVKLISSNFPTHWHNSRKFGINQILLTIIMASISGINRINKISVFSNDGLVRALLNLPKEINENAISTTLKKLSESGARNLQKLLLKKSSSWLKKSNLTSITLDADSTVKSVCGNQQGVAKGFNSSKKGAKSYHPLLVFVSELKLLYHSWFRTGSSYTSNGIVEFLKEVKSSLPTTISKVFFRADSGFFSGSLIEQLRSFDWDFLIKVKLKNLVKLMESQNWVEVSKGVWICEFNYENKSLKSSVKLKGMRTVKEYIEKDFFGEKELIPIYQYVCYCSNYDLNAVELHENYKQRSTSETWIEQVKGQVMAGSTLTDNFWANDILWQLSVFAYNISVMMRYKHKRFFKQEHKTFLEWFILVPGKITKTARKLHVKMYKHHFYKDDWIKLEMLN